MKRSSFGSDRSPSTRLMVRAPYAHLWMSGGGRGKEKQYYSAFHSASRRGNKWFWPRGMTTIGPSFASYCSVLCKFLMFRSKGEAHENQKTMTSRLFLGPFLAPFWPTLIVSLTLFESHFSVLPGYISAQSRYQMEGIGCKITTVKSIASHFMIHWSYPQKKWKNGF